jgi:hypothetical protein
MSGCGALGWALIKSIAVEGGENVCEGRMEGWEGRPAYIVSGMHSWSERLAVVSAISLAPLRSSIEGLKLTRVE